MEEEKDYYEQLEDAKKEYEKETAYLLQKIEKREEMIGLLKIAKPDKIKDIQEIIPRFDKSIDQTEKILGHIAERIELIKTAIKHHEELDEILEISQKEFLEYIKTEKPEKLEEAEAMLFGEGSSH